MSKNFTIYHVPSLHKVGCTRNFKKRKAHYPGLKVVVLEIISAEKGPKFAGDIEWAYAIKFGYKHYGHYTNTWDFKLTKKQRRIFAKRGYAARSPETKTPEFLRHIGSAKIPTKGVGGMDPAKAEYIARKGAKANGRSPNNAFRQILTCPHCGKTGNGGNMQRWHFDNCSI